MKIVVAYSGGLDTSVMIKWLKDKYDAEIITATGNLGQNLEIKGTGRKSNKNRRIKSLYFRPDEEFIEGYIFPALKAGHCTKNLIL